MKKKRLLGLAAVVVFLLLLVLILPEINTLRTLSTVRKVSDYPMYMMHFYGDYGFDDYLDVGTQPNGALLQKEEESWACTCFAALNPAGEKVFGRNFDWAEHPILVLYTDPPEGYASVSMVDISYLGYDRSGVPLFGRRKLLETPYLPFDGMNEHGLAVGMMAVSHALGGKNPQKVTISELQAIRLMLDHARDVESAIQLLDSYNISFEDPPIHYLIADAAGHSAVIEYLDGRMTVMRSKGNWQVATNFIMANVSKGEERLQCHRYAIADAMLEEVDGQVSITRAMQILEEVSQSSTIWSTVYDLSSGEFQIALEHNYDEIFKFSLMKVVPD